MIHGSLGHATAKSVMDGRCRSPSPSTSASRFLVWARTIALLMIGWTASGIAVAGYVFTTLTPANQAGGGSLGVPLAINNLGQIVGFTDYSTPKPTLWTSPATPVQLPSYGIGTYAVDINDAGVVVGWQLSGSSSPGIKWVNSTPILLSQFGYSAAATGINNSGQIVGDSAYFPSTPVMLDPTGAIIYLNGPGLSTGINDAGQVSGTFENDPARWTGTTPTLLGTLGGGSGSASTSAINNNGQVIGYSLAPDGYYHATLWNDIEAIDLGFFGSHSYALGINSDGDVVGQGNYANGGSGAFLWNSNGFVDLNTLLDQETVNAGWRLHYASGINDAGQIIGVARNSITNESQGFLLTPTDVPEPATYWLILAGLGSMLLIRRDLGSRQIS